MRKTAAAFAAAMLAAGTAAGESATCSLPTFGAPLAAGVSDVPSVGAAVGDFLVDGHLDVVVISQADNSLTTLEGSGTTSMRSGVRTSVSAPVDVVAADFDGDGLVDVAVVNEGVSDGSVTAMLSTGTGTFTAVPSGASLPHAAAAARGDFNQDGLFDLVVVGGPPDATGSIWMLAGDGLGNFSSAFVSDTSGRPVAVGAADFDADGTLDLAVVVERVAGGAGAIDIRMGGGDGTFAAAETVTVGGGPRALVAYDLTGDGRVDIAVANASDETVSVFAGNGAGGFTPGGSVAVGATPRALAAVDADGDGDADLLVADERLTPLSFVSTAMLAVLPNDGSGGFAGDQIALGRHGSAAREIVLGDFDADGRIDVVEADDSGTAQAWVRRNGCGLTADLSVTMTDSRDPVQGGDVASYSITVTNTGPDRATTVALRADFPAGFALLRGEVQSSPDASGSPSYGCHVVRDRVVCVVPQLEPGQSAAIVAHARVVATTSGTSSIRAHATSDARDPEAANSEAAESTTVHALGGRRMNILTSVHVDAVRLEWHGGDVQSGYVVVRMAGGVTTRYPTLPASATSFTDPTPRPNEMNCYAVSPVDTEGVPLGRSAMVCIVPGHSTPPFTPDPFTLTLDGRFATVSWLPSPAGGSAFVVAMWSADSPAKYRVLPRNIPRLVVETDRSMCFTVAALDGETIAGNTDTLCVVPGISTVP
jgi:uncharacterized repeat protein (TIGR01451 family)